MPVVRCPFCQHNLSLPEQYLGAAVRCSACNNAFQVAAQAPALPVVSPSPLPAALPPPVAVPSAAPSPFAFDGGAGEVVRTGNFSFDEDPEAKRGRRLIQSAAGYMQGTVVLATLWAVLAAIGGLIQGLSAGNLAYAFGTLVGALLPVCPVVFIHLGSQSLQRRTSYGLAMTGAIFALLFASGALGLTGVAGLTFLTSLVAGACGLSIVLLVLSAIGAAITFVAGMAGIKTLMALNNPAVKAGFDRRAGRGREDEHGPRSRRHRRYREEDEDYRSRRRREEEDDARYRRRR